MNMIPRLLVVAILLLKIGSAAEDPPLFRPFSTGYKHVCAITTEGSVHCAGENQHNQEIEGLAADPENPFKSISSGAHAMCVLREDQTVKCWGENDMAEEPTEEKLIQLHCHYKNCCGLTTDNRAVCWGSNHHGTMDATPAEETFKRVAAGGDRVACGIRLDGSINCWGVDDQNVLSDIPEVGHFVEVGCGHRHCCALNTDGSIQCWGDDRSSNTGSVVSNTPSETNYERVCALSGAACALNSEGKAYCWGRNTDGLTNAPTDKTFVHIECSNLFACGVDSDGYTYCWGMDKGYYNDLFPQTNEQNFQVDVSLLQQSEADEVTDNVLQVLRPISFGYKHGCAILTDGSIHCAGIDHNNEEILGQDADLENPFVSVTSGAHDVCALRSDQTVVCWGDHDYINGGTEEKLTQIHCFYKNCCGLTADFHPICWGSNSHGTVDATPLEEEFKVITAGGDRIACGIRFDGSISCWGVDEENVLSDVPQEGDFVEIGCGDRACCALTKEGSVICWGDNRETNTGKLVDNTPPDSNYASVCMTCSAACALDFEGKASCWGKDQDGLTSPPSDKTFEYITCGDMTACGVDSDGYTFCWGFDKADIFDEMNNANFQVNIAIAETTTTGDEEGEYLEGGDEEGEDSEGGNDCTEMRRNLAATVCDCELKVPSMIGSAMFGSLLTLALVKFTDFGNKRMSSASYDIEAHV